MRVVAAARVGLVEVAENMAAVKAEAPADHRVARHRHRKSRRIPTSINPKTISRSEAGALRLSQRLDLPGFCSNSEIVVIASRARCRTTSRKAAGEFFPLFA